MSYKYDVGIYIGRFQPPHKAHLESFKEALTISEKLLIFVGSYGVVPTVLNPWDFETRQKLIIDAIKEYISEEVSDRIEILPLRDYLYNDYKWVSEVQARAQQHGAGRGSRVCLFGCEKDDTSYYLSMFPTWNRHLFSIMFNHLSATSVRKELFEDGMVKSADTLAECTRTYIEDWLKTDKGKHLSDEWAHYEAYKAKWDVAPFPVTFVTTDAIVIKNGCVLMVRRKFHPGKGLWALPGGFLNQNETLENSMLRELKEETRIMVPKSVLEANIKEVRTFDHPRRSLRGRTLTHAFLIDLGNGGELPSVQGDDDASEAYWFPIADAYKMEGQLFEDHSSIIHAMTSKY